MNRVHSGLTASIPVENLSALIARLEAAESKDAWIHAPDVHLVLFNTSCARAIKSPSVTTSVDAALDLVGKVLPGWLWDVTTITTSVGGLRKPLASVVHPDQPEGQEIKTWGYGSTPALALCIATLRAKLDGYAAEGEVNKNPKAQEG